MQALKDFSWFFVILLTLAIVWVLSGGPYSESAKNPFIKPPSPLDSGDTYGFGLFPESKNSGTTANKTGFGTTYGESLFSGTKSNASTGTDSISEQLKNIGTETAQIKEELEKIEEKTNKSEYADLITFSRAGATSSTADREYLEISLSKTAKNKVIITGWNLKSLISGVSVKIEDASWLPRLGGSNTKNVIVLSPGDKAVINTGRSPVGTSFRTNMCVGYFSQFQSFYPSLKRDCPDPYKDIEEKYLSGPNAFNDQCLDFIDRIQICNINTSQLPLNMQSQCQDFVTKKINYNSCIDTHKNDEKFYGNEWRIYLSRDTELWKSKREIIELTDGIGKTVGTVTY